jgi:hypothetical protein
MIALEAEVQALHATQGLLDSQQQEEIGFAKTADAEHIIFLSVQLALGVTIQSLKMLKKFPPLLQEL